MSLHTEHPLISKANIINKAIAYTVAYLSVIMMLSMTTLVIRREVFTLGSLMLQDSLLYMHGALFMLGLAYTLQVDEHVRVDIFYNKFTEQGKSLVNLFGGIVLLVPLCVFMIYTNWSSVSSAWQIKEASANAGGLPFLYLLKTTMVIMPVLLLLQALIQIVKDAMVVLSPKSTDHTPQS